jgi:hypothetical protein
MSIVPTLRRAALVAALTGAAALRTAGLTIAQAPMPAPAAVAVSEARFARLGEDDIRRWLTYLSSDLMQGRAVFTEGYGLAASYVASELGAMGVTPLGDNGTYLQGLTRGTYQVTRGGTVTIEAGGERRTFRHGEQVTFPVSAGSRQRLTFDGVEFLGAGPVVGGGVGGAAAARDLEGKLVLFMPTPTGAREGRAARGLVATQSAHLIDVRGAAAVVALVPELAAGEGNGARTDAQPTTVSSVSRMDTPRAPALIAGDEVFDLVLRRAPSSLADLRAIAGRGEPLPAFTVPDVSMTVEIDNTYEMVTSQFTQNVVGMVEGAEPALSETYVFFGAHLDHEGYATSNEPLGRVNTPLDRDRIWNGADDNASGSAALLAMAKAFMTGPRPKRSVVFVWHAGEEAGLLGSAYMAENPVVPLDRIQAQLNVDMIGRNRDNKSDQENTVYVIGADRISTDLHNLIVEANAAQARPLTLDYEFNDSADPNRFYVRSDHFSYASKGIPIAFFFTGEHPDYHANTDSVDKIVFPKLVRIAQLIYETGFRIADSTDGLARDYRGPRSGRGFRGTLD